MKKIVFVCTGNTCRSVLAEYMFRKMLDEDNGMRNSFEILSCGTDASPFYKIPEFVTKMLKKEGIEEVLHNSTQIDAQIFKNAEMFFVMENHHKMFIEQNFEKTGKVFLLGESEEIPDPIGMSEEFYFETFQNIKKYLTTLKEKLKNDYQKK